MDKKLNFLFMGIITVFFIIEFVILVFDVDFDKAKTETVLMPLFAISFLGLPVFSILLLVKNLDKNLMGLGIFFLSVGVSLFILGYISDYKWREEFERFEENSPFYFAYVFQSILVSIFGVFFVIKKLKSKQIPYYGSRKQ